MTWSFAWPWMFACLPLPYLVWRFAPVASHGGAIRVPFFELLEASTGDHRQSATWMRAVVVATCWVLLVSAAARPQWVGDLERIPASGRNLMLAVDLSGSMKVEDLELDGHQVDRLTVVRLLGSDFLERRVGDRVGLILFGSQAYLQAPLSFDRATVGTLLAESFIGIAGERTAIGDAIGLAIKSLRLEQAEHRVLVLLTDGANTAGSVDPREAARLAATAGLRIHTVGIGASSMRVNSLFGAREINPSAELDEAMLRDIAGTTGGQYFRADTSAALEEVYDLLDTIEPVPQTDRDARRVEEVFHWPLSVVALGVLVWMLLGVRGRRDAGRQP